jgi:hypothetical protein
MGCRLSHECIISDANQKDEAEKLFARQKGATRDGAIARWLVS